MFQKIWATSKVVSGIGNRSTTETQSILIHYKLEGRHFPRVLSRIKGHGRKRREGDLDSASSFAQDRVSLEHCWRSRWLLALPLPSPRKARASHFITQLFLSLWESLRAALKPPSTLATAVFESLWKKQRLCRCTLASAGCAYYTERQRQQRSLGVFRRGR